MLMLQECLRLTSLRTASTTFMRTCVGKDGLGRLRFIFCRFFIAYKGKKMQTLRQDREAPATRSTCERVINHSPRYRQACGDAPGGPLRCRLPTVLILWRL